MALDYHCGKHILYPLNANPASHPDNENAFRSYMLATRDRLIEYGYDVHFEESGYGLVQADAAAILGDLDGSGWVDLPDVQELAAHWHSVPDVLYDLDGDGVVTVADIMTLVQWLGRQIGG